MLFVAPRAPLFVATSWLLCGYFIAYFVASMWLLRCLLHALRWLLRGLFMASSLSSSCSSLARALHALHALISPGSTCSLPQFSPLSPKICTFFTLRVEYSGALQGCFWVAAVVLFEGVVNSQGELKPLHLAPALSCSERPLGCSNSTEGNQLIRELLYIHT